MLESCCRYEGESRRPEKDWQAHHEVISGRSSEAGDMGSAVSR
jgi:hypothetical protein